MVQQLEGDLLDLRLRLRPARAPSDAIVLVVIDEQSLAGYGR